MKIYDKIKTFVFLIACLCSAFPLMAEEGKKGIHINKNPKFFDIPPTSYASVPKNNLVEIGPFSSDFPALVVTFNYSPLNNGIAFFTFKVPADLKKNKTFSIDLVLLTPPVDIKGNVNLEVNYRIIRKTGSIDSFNEMKIFSSPVTLKVKGASPYNLAKTYEATFTCNKTDFTPGDTVIITLARNYRIPDGFKSSISVLSTTVNYSVSPSNEKNCPCGCTDGCTTWGCKCDDAVYNNGVCDGCD